MKHLVLFILYGWALNTQAQDIARLRQEFVVAPESAAGAEKLFRTTGTISVSSRPLLRAYRGAALLIWGKYAKGVEEKKKLALEGIRLLESAVAQSPDHLEIRTLRLSIQENSPKVLKYKGRIEEDRTFVTLGYEELPEGELKKFIGGYLLKSEKK